MKVARQSAKNDVRTVWTPTFKDPVLKGAFNTTFWRNNYTTTNYSMFLTSPLYDANGPIYAYGHEEEDQDKDQLYNFYLWIFC